LEPELKAFLKRIVFTLSFGLVWLIINATAGIKYGFAFWDDTFTWKNGVFYVWFCISFIAIFIYLKKLWSKPLDLKKYF
jgi:hypothetical protein